MACRREHPHSWDGIDVLGLEADSYTAGRLQHATPLHLHVTSRRYFIGPIPEGWLKTHRRDWYRHHLNINYTSRTATFSSNPREAYQRRISGLEGPSASATLIRSFPQPEDVEEVDESEQSKDASTRQNVQEWSNNGSMPIQAKEISGTSVPRASEQRGGMLNAEEEPEFVDAPSEPDADMEAEANDINHGLVPVKRRTARPSSTKSYHTAFAAREPSTTEDKTQESIPDENETRESTPNEDQGAERLQDEVQEQASSLQVPKDHQEEVLNLAGKQRISMVESYNSGPSGSILNDPSAETGSTTSLLRKANTNELQFGAAPEPRTKGILTKMKRRSEGTLDVEPGLEHTDTRVTRTKSHLRHLVKFDIPEDSKRAELHMKAKAAQMTIQRASTKLRRQKIRDGLVVKMERMLLRVDEAGKGVPDDYDENGNQKIDSRVKDKWREYMVVCRQCISDQADFVLQMYKTRVIPEIEQAHTNKRAQYEIPLGRKVTKVNLYSSLDKSLVVWVPGSRGTKIFVMQARTASNATEWYTFIRNILGWRRASELQINVPDLSINLHLTNPFQKLEVSQNDAQDVEDEDSEEAILRTMKEEQAVARNLIRRCVEMLGDTPEWKDVLNTWLNSQRIGLAWRRYDRLEWIHGANERKMYGTIAMAKSHELELRPKVHYPTTAVTRKKHKTLEEPVPVEGFLIRLTSQRGATRRMGLLFHKQLYFSTHDQFLVFSRPAKVTPPPPPELPVTRDSVPDVREISNKTPNTWTVNPYPLKNNEIEWLAGDGSDKSDKVRLCDEGARSEAERKADLLLNCDGYINLCNVAKVRKAIKGAAPVDNHIESGSDVDFDEDVDDNTTRDDGVTTEFDIDRTFELVLQNGLIIRLQAADKERRKDWVKHLRALVKYWKLRIAADVGLYISTRAQNLAALNIDEEAEAYIGQYAKKWEVTQSFACPQLYNLCGISNCRAIHMSGTLYRKPRIHAPFTRCAVILTAGTLCIFRDVLRNRTGKAVKHIQHEHMANLSLKDCYIYSGFLTQSDLLYQNQTFDPNKPGHHALPRVYLEDGWTSTDEDVMTTFVVWHGKSKSWFRSEEATGNGEEESAKGEGKRTRLKRVAKLGSTGRSVVFRARSRAERDHWVLAIQAEIERCQQGRAEDFRIEESVNYVEGEGRAGEEEADGE
ncbi:hypothetical protein GQ43DRAFT_481352 [Delitschia confertaspora ATCC 74209]|uniref:PH domain-containing protein n=1 Tax=Delitschia confertaspora ATCC 74209 TaxID=1513339 RepID=A0A9P4MV09_9PLEO|nr:hypothetical protein GQ43DRAFT_481352 [Delitschia confertaspora ATCC 74209]